MHEIPNEFKKKRMSLPELNIALNVKYAQAFSPPLDKKSNPT